MSKPNELYDAPKYYDLAFSFRHYEEEVAVMREAIGRHSRIPVRRVLELACGHCPHLGEWVRHGYHYTGLDMSPAMLAYARQRAPSADPARHALVHGDMTAFNLDAPVDFACTLLGSLYAQNTAQLHSHYDCVARTLRPGGLYLLDWCVEFDPFTDIADAWTVTDEGITAAVSYVTRHLDRLEQTIEEEIRLDVDDHGTQAEFEQRTRKRVMYPQEFLLFATHRTDFEFVGWWNNWDLGQPLESASHINRPIIVLRRLG